mmetsp:Transcript_62316/g.140941  ORF Transcript_62316/g.140941 Transcript_62316/m.140941 type:complete len:378 (-) Transcript_62316:513-1646(-)
MSVRLPRGAAPAASKVRRYGPRRVERGCFLGRGRSLALLEQRRHLVGDHLAVRGVHCGEVGDGALADELLSAHHVARDVGGEAVPGSLVKHRPEVVPALPKVVLVARLHALHVARQFVRVPRRRHVLGRPVEAVREVVGAAAAVGPDLHGPVALVIGHLGGEGLVHGDLLVVGAQPVAVGVRVREEAGLEHLVRGGLDARDHVPRREGDLLNLAEVVFGVAVEDHAADLEQGELPVAPHLGHVERVGLGRGGLLHGHHLHVDRPRRRLPRRDGIVQVSRGIVGVTRGQGPRLLGTQVGDPLVRLEVVLHVHGLARRVHVLEGVAPVAVHVPVAVRRAAVAHQKAYLVGSFRPQRDEVPKRVRVAEVGLRVALLRVDE